MRPHVPHARHLGQRICCVIMQEPCLSFVLRDVICGSCNSCRDLDLCRDPDLQVRCACVLYSQLAACAPGLLSCPFVAACVLQPSVLYTKNGTTKSRS